MLSSIGIKLCCCSIIHAGGAGGCGHTGCLDAQPLIASTNSSSQPAVFSLRFGQCLRVLSVQLCGLDCQLMLCLQLRGQSLGFLLLGFELARNLRNRRCPPVEF